MPVRSGFFSVLIISFISFLSPAFAGPDNLIADDTEESAAVSGGFEAAFHRAYLWRGMEFGNGPVAQPYFWITKKDFTFSTGANFNLLASEFTKSCDELDLEILYEHSFKLLEAAAKIDFYSYFFQEDSPPTAEAAIKLTYPTNLINIFAEHTVDFAAYRGAWFTQTGFSKEYCIKEKLTVEPSVSMCYGSAKFNETYVELPLQAFTVLNNTLSVTYDFSNVYLSALLEYNQVLNDELASQIETEHTYNLAFTIGKEF